MFPKSAIEYALETLLVMVAEEDQRLDLTLSCLIHEKDDEIIEQLMDETIDLIRRKAALNAAITLLGGNPLP